MKYIKNKKYLLYNINFNKKYERSDILQIRYGKDLAMVLQQYFKRSFNFIKQQHEINISNGVRKWIKLPDEYKEYLAIFNYKY